jgi:hypothetical protein
MTIQQSSGASGMTIARVAPSKAGPVRLATPYLEVEARSTSSLERAIRRELAPISHATRKKLDGGHQPSHRVARR